MLGEYFIKSYSGYVRVYITNLENFVDKIFIFYIIIFFTINKINQSKRIIIKIRFYLTSYLIKLNNSFINRMY